MRFQIDQAPKEFLHGAYGRFHLQRFRHLFGNHFDAGAQIRFLANVLDHTDAFHALDHQAHGPIRRFEDAMDLGGGTNAMDLVRGGLFDPLVATGNQGDHAVFGECIFDQADATLLPDW